MRKYSLVLTNNVNIINKKENLISIRPLKYILDCNDLSDDSEFNNISRSEIVKRYKFCEKIYKNLLNHLSIELNKLHKVNYSLRSWDIIAGRWLKNYIHTCFKTYLEIKFVLTNYKINKIYILDQQKFNITVDDTMSHELAFSDEEWFFSICSNIINHLNLKKKIVKNSPKKKFFKINNYKQEKNINIKFFSIIFKFLKKIINFNNYAFITQTYLPFYYEKILETKLLQFPSIWPEIFIKYKKKDQQMRLNLKIKKNNKVDLFENFLRENLYKFLPNFIIENFTEINKLVDSGIFPKNPKFIFTSGSYAYNEVFKHYVAKKINSKIPYYLGQHGNNYFTKIHNSYLQELKQVDKFISWGFKKKPLVEKGFNFKVLKKRDYFNKDGKLIIVFDYLNTMAFNLHNTNFSILKHIKNTIEVIKSLKPEIKKKIVVRLNKTFYQNFFGIKYANFFNHLNVEIDNGEKNIHSLMKEARLSLFSYDSTGVLENFIYKYPTIFFCEKNYLNTINKSYLIKYNILKKNKIMFLDKEKLIEYLNKNWNNIPAIWFNRSSQIAIKKFNKNLNNKPNQNSLDILKKILVNKKR